LTVQKSGADPYVIYTKQQYWDLCVCLGHDLFWKVCFSWRDGNGPDEVIWDQSEMSPFFSCGLCWLGFFSFLSLCPGLSCRHAF
jgi:hypothetical protein